MKSSRASELVLNWRIAVLRYSIKIGRRLMRWSAPDFTRHDDQAQAYLLDFAGANHASRSVQ